MVPETNPQALFPGFPDFRANVTFVPIQFFTVVVPHCSRGTVRIVGYALRKILGWVDEHGQPTCEQLQFTYRELIERAGVSRESIAEALREAVERRCLSCVQTPQPDTAGQPGRSGIYELCWDHEGRYTDRPDEFRGFYYPAAALVEVREGTSTVRRPKAARKNIPNAFFDELLPRERLSVIRVVGALLFYAIQWGPGGERKVPVSRSITELSRLAKLSRHHVHAAVLEARRRGYIEQVEAGCFDPAAARDSRPATYAIRWVRSPARPPIRTPRIQNDPPVGKGEREAERSEKGDGAPVGNGPPDRSDRVHGEQSEMVNEIRIKTELKTETTAPDTVTPAVSQAMAAADPGLDRLLQAGFDRATAQRLAGKHPLELIQRQLDWLPLRSSTRNRLGLLRRAIEQDWPKPETGDAGDDAAPFGDPRLGRIFASHFYAVYHGYLGEAATEPFPKDLHAATAFVERLLGLERNPDAVSEWGRRFGRLLRDKHHRDPKAKPYLAGALVLYGDEFLRVVQQEIGSRCRQTLGRAQELHQTTFAAAYRDYLRAAEERCQQTQPERYAEFVERRRLTRQRMTGGLFLASADTVARFDGEECRLQAFAEFFHRHPECPVLEFWQWDARENPQRFGRAAVVPTPELAPTPLSLAPTS